MRKIAHLKLIIFNLFLLNNFLYSQEDDKEFKPSGKIIAKSFFEYSNNFKNEDGFNITRAYLGYNYKINPYLEARVVLDGASTRNQNGRLETYVKNAYVNWKKDNWNIHIGLTGVINYDMQDKYWTLRYVMEPLLGYMDTAPSTDLGITSQYSFNDFFSADLSITNGEGYRIIRKDNSMRYALGLNLSPIKNSVIRVAADYYNKGTDDKTEPLETDQRADQKLLFFLAGYKNENISLGAEYLHYYNKDFIDGKNLEGYSIYSAVRVAPKWRVFGRYDWANSSTPESFEESWGLRDGEIFAIGLDFSPIKEIRISPNFKNYNYNRRSSEQFFFMNFEFDL